MYELLFLSFLIYVENVIPFYLKKVKVISLYHVGIVSLSQNLYYFIQLLVTLVNIYLIALD